MKSVPQSDSVQDRSSFIWVLFSVWDLCPTLSASLPKPDSRCTRSALDRSLSLMSVTDKPCLPNSDSPGYDLGLGHGATELCEHQTGTYRGSGQRLCLVPLWTTTLHWRLAGSPGRLIMPAERSTGPRLMDTLMGTRSRLSCRVGMAEMGPYLPLGLGASLALP